MKRIIQYFKNRKERKQLQDEAMLKAEFKVVERDGNLWLTHDGVAFMKVNVVSYAYDVASELNKARETAIEFKNL